MKRLMTTWLLALALAGTAGIAGAQETKITGYLLGAAPVAARWVRRRCSSSMLLQLRRGAGPALGGRAQPLTAPRVMPFTK